MSSQTRIQTRQVSMLAEDEAQVRETANHTVALSLVTVYRSNTTERHSKLRVACYRFSKRVLDLMLGLILLCCSLPLIIVAAIAVRIESRGNPALHPDARRRKRKAVQDLQVARNVCGCARTVSGTL